MIKRHMANWRGGVRLPLSFTVSHGDMLANCPIWSPEALEVWREQARWPR